MLFELAIGIPLNISIKKYTCYNMHSVSSNAVAEQLEVSELKTLVDNGSWLIKYRTMGKLIIFTIVQDQSPVHGLLLVHLHIKIISRVVPIIHMKQAPDLLHNSLVHQ